jgi:type IV pilus assembly protein PilC
VLARLSEKSASPRLLAQSLYELADVHDTTAGYGKALAAALIYPAKLFGIAVLFWIVAMVFVTPVFEELFRDFGSQLPEPTQKLLDVSQWVRDYALFLLGGLGLFLSILAAAPRVRIGMIWLVPSLRTVVRNNAALHFCHLLAILGRYGFSLTDAVQLSVAAMPSSVFARQFKRIEAESRDLAGFKGALLNTFVLPKSILALVQIIDRAEALPAAFGHFSAFLRKGFDAQLARAYKTVEIGAFIAMAVVIGAMVIALYLPIFHMAGAIGG